MAFEIRLLQNEALDAALALARDVFFSLRRPSMAHRGSPLSDGIFWRIPAFIRPALREKTAFGALTAEKRWFPSWGCRALAISVCPLPARICSGKARRPPYFTPSSHSWIGKARTSLSSALTPLHTACLFTCIWGFIPPGPNNV